jgi:hypothetical protein
VAVNDALNEASVVIPYNQLVVHPVTTVADAEAGTTSATDG